MPDLLKSFEAIRSEGARVFYEGSLGRAIVADVQRRGGILSQQDMDRYRAEPVEPVTVVVNGRVLAAAPPAAGGLTCLQMVALLERLKARGRIDAPDPAEEYESFLEVSKVAWEDRLTKLGDPRFMEGPPSSLLSDAHLDRLLDRILEGLANPRKGRLVAPDPLRGTVHLAAADSEGNVVSWTQTHGGGFGSNVMVKGTGIVLGHGMCRFEPRPGWANSVAAGKRPLHNMCPVIALENGRPVLAVGAAGGRTIVNNVAALTAARLLRGDDPARAVARPRLQCETKEPVTIEKSVGPEVLEKLRARGHEVKETVKDAGVAHMISAAESGWTAVAETRSATAGAASA